MPRVSIVDPYPVRAADKFRQDFGIADDHLSIYAEPFSENFDLNKML